MSSPGWQLITLEIVLGFGVPLAWAVWQLIDLRRYRAQDEAERLARQRQRQPPDPPDDPAQRPP